MLNKNAATDRGLFKILKKIGIRCTLLPNGDIRTFFHGKHGIFDHVIGISREGTTSFLIIAVPYLFKLREETKALVLEKITKINHDLPTDAFKVGPNGEVLFIVKIPVRKREITEKSLLRILFLMSQIVDKKMGILMPLNWGREHREKTTAVTNGVNRFKFSLN